MDLKGESRCMDMKFEILAVNGLILLREVAINILYFVLESCSAVERFKL